MRAIERDPGDAIRTHANSSPTCAILLGPAGASPIPSRPGPSPSRSRPSRRRRVGRRPIRRCAKHSTGRSHGSRNRSDALENVLKGMIATRRRNYDEARDAYLGRDARALGDRERSGVRQDRVEVRDDDPAKGRRRQARPQRAARCASTASTKPDVSFTSTVFTSSTHTRNTRSTRSNAPPSGSSSNPSMPDELSRSFGAPSRPGVRSPGVTPTSAPTFSSDWASCSVRPPVHRTSRFSLPASSTSASASPTPSSPRPIPVAGGGQYFVTPRAGRHLRLHRRLGSAARFHDRRDALCLDLRRLLQPASAGAQRAPIHPWVHFVVTLSLIVGLCILNVIGVREIDRIQRLRQRARRGQRDRDPLASDSCSRSAPSCWCTRCRRAGRRPIDLMLGISLAIISFVGLESISQAAQETQRPASIIPRTSIALILTILIFALVVCEPGARHATVAPDSSMRTVTRFSFWQILGNHDNQGKAVALLARSGTVIGARSRPSTCRFSARSCS